MKKQVEESMNKLTHLVYYASQGGRTTGEVRSNVTRALGPAQREDSERSVFDDPEISTETELKVAMDVEIEKAREDWERIMQPTAERKSEELSKTENFGGLDLGAIARLESIKDGIVNETELNASGQKVLGEVREDMARAEEIIQAVQIEHKSMATKVVEKDPAAAARILAYQTLEQPADQAKAGSISEDPRTLAEEAITDYKPVTLKHTDPGTDRVSHGKNGQFLTTNKASRSPEPEQGVADIRALDTYFAMAFPNSELSSGEDRASTLLRYAVLQDKDYRTELAESIQRTVEQQQKQEAGQTLSR